MSSRRNLGAKRSVWLSGFGALMGILAVLAIQVTAIAQSRTAELIMVEKAGCPWCVAWDRDVAPAYANSPEAQIAPLRRIDIADWRRAGVTFSAPLTVTPTFVLVAEGREIGRITGYPGADFFWGLLDEQFLKLRPAPARAPPPRDARFDDGSDRSQRGHDPASLPVRPVTYWTGSARHE